jgi:Surface antigen variable number repeat
MDDGNWVYVEFVLSSESVKVVDFKIKTFDSQEPEIWKMLAKSDTNLHVGGTYTWPAESAAYTAISFLYRAQGKLIGVIPEVKIDYKQGKAWVNFRVVEGPATLKHPLSPPYGEWCDDRVRYIDWTGSDVGIPFELIESGLALGSPFTCFSNELAQKDKAYLSNLSFLSASTVEYSGPFGNRTIRYKLTAKPLRVEKINLRGYGYAPPNLGDTNPDLLKNLTLKKGELYSRSTVRESTEYLRKACTKNGYWAEVNVQEELSGADALRVTFSVLLFPLQTIIERICE